MENSKIKKKTFVALVVLLKVVYLTDNLSRIAITPLNVVHFVYFMADLICQVLEITDCHAQNFSKTTITRIFLSIDLCHLYNIC